MIIIQCFDRLYIKYSGITIVMYTMVFLKHLEVPSLWYMNGYTMVKLKKCNNNKSGIMVLIVQLISLPHLWRTGKCLRLTLHEPNS